MRQDEIDAPYYLARFTPYRSAAHGVEGVVATFVDVTSVAKSEECERTLVAELNHRVKNVLAVILAIAQQTLSRSASPAASAPAFLARLQAMRRVHERSARKLGRRRHRGSRRSGARAVFVCRKTSASRCRGRRGHCRRSWRSGLGVALDVPATNAVKIGRPVQRIRTYDVIRGGARTQAKGRKLELVWRESGAGPCVGAPTKDGFGLTSHQAGKSD